MRLKGPMKRRMGRMNGVGNDEGAGDDAYRLVLEEKSGTMKRQEK